MTTYKKIYLFIFLTFALSWAMMGYIISEYGTAFSTLSMILMWIPGLVGLGCSKVFGYEYEDIGFRRPKTRNLVIGYAVPACATVLLFLILIATGIGEATTSGVTATFRILIFSTTFGVLMSMITTMGEEIGWRGFLHMQIRRSGWSQSYIVTGALWALWHWPLIIFADYANTKLPVLSVILFSVTLISFSVFLGWLRDESQSIWPVALAHASHNTWIQVIYPGFHKAGPLNPYFGGEAGFVLAILYLCLAIAISRRASK